MKNVSFRKRSVSKKTLFRKKLAKKMENKKGIVTDYLPWILIAVAVLVILSVTIFVLREKGISAIDTIKNLFRWN